MVHKTATVAATLSSGQKQKESAVTGLRGTGQESDFAFSSPLHSESGWALGQERISAPFQLRTDSVFSYWEKEKKRSFWLVWVLVVVFLFVIFFASALMST